jgi:DNA repair protein RecO (recombination protein O)
VILNERTTGLILRVRPLTETSLIVNWLTLDFGRLSTVAKGARRSKSPFAGKLDLFYLADFSFHRSRRSDLHTLREVSVMDTHRALRLELAYLSQIAYFVHLLEQTTETETPLPVLFRLLSEALRLLPRHLPQALTVLAFEMKVLVELGLEPDLNHAKLSPGAREILGLIGLAELNVVFRIKPASRQLTEISSFLREFIVYHAGKLPAGRQEALGH